MSAGAILVTWAVVIIGASLIVALLFHFWPRYGSIDAAIERSDEMLDKMETTANAH